MKKITILSASIIASIAMVGLVNAATPGAYVGVGLGSSSLKTPDSFLFNTNNTYNSTNKHQRGGLGGRVFAGYNFDKFLGLETSYASYASSLYKASANGANASLKYSLDAVSLVGKVYLPFDDSGFNAYALGGLADVRNQVRYSNNGVPLASGVTANLKNGTTNYYHIRPVYGVGVSYDLQEHLSTNVELSRIQGTGNVKTSASAIPNADMISLNLGYNFG